jgi:hypothetical protein
MSGKADVRLQIRARGMPQYIKKLQKLGVGLEELDKPMLEAGKLAKAAMASYPTYNDGWKQGNSSFSLYRPGAKYKRTGTLRDSWRGRLVKGSRIIVRYSVSTRNVNYAKYVLGGEQTEEHRPWWRKSNEWDRLLTPEVTKIFQKHMQKYMK